MRMHYVRTGGFAGIKLETQVDSETLPPEEARSLVDEVRQSGFFKLPGQLKAAPGGADRFQYTLTIWDAAEVHTVEIGEAQMPDSLRPLVQHLDLLARTRKQG